MKSMNSDINIILEKWIASPYNKVEENIYTCIKNPGRAPYDNKARFYEILVQSHLYNKIAWGTTPEVYADFARRSIESCEGLILDIGCGGLAATSEAYSRIKNPVILMDYSLEMLRIGKKRIMKKTGSIPENIVFLQGDAFNLPFKKGSIENIINFGMLHLFDDKQEYLKRIFMVLKKKGRFFFTSITNDREFSKYFTRFLQKRKELGEVVSSREMLKLFQGNGKIQEHFNSGSMMFIAGKDKWKIS